MLRAHAKESVLLGIERRLRAHGDEQIRGDDQCQIAKPHLILVLVASNFHDHAHQPLEESPLAHGELGADRSITLSVYALDDEV